MYVLTLVTGASLVGVVITFLGNRGEGQLRGGGQSSALRAAAAPPWRGLTTRLFPSRSDPIESLS